MCILSLCQGAIPCHCGPSPDPRTDMGVWIVCSESEQLLACMAVYYFQHITGIYIIIYEQWTAMLHACMYAQ